MKIASWNVRGFNGPSTQKAVLRLIRKHRIDVISILETKIEELEDLHHILLTKFGGWRAAHNFDLITGGRMVVCWNPQVVELHVEQRKEQLIHCAVRCRRTQIEVQLTVVYGLYSIVARRPLWSNLIELGRRMNTPWLCIGDFNAYLKPTDKVGGPPISGYMIRDFEECCTQTGLSEMPSTGP